MSEWIKLKTPLSKKDVSTLKAGDKVLLSGKVFTARDAAHKRLVELIQSGGKLPFNLEGQVIYYVGPTPPPPGKVIGSAGPTTSYRMDPYAPVLMERGVRGMIGKGSRSSYVKDAMKKWGCVYFAAVGGAGALLSKRIKAARVVAYEDLGPEAVRELEVEDFPVIVINDIYGSDLYEEGIKKYQRF